MRGSWRENRIPCREAANNRGKMESAFGGKRGNYGQCAGGDEGVPAGKSVGKRGDEGPGLAVKKVGRKGSSVITENEGKEPNRTDGDNE